MIKNPMVISTALQQANETACKEGKITRDKQLFPFSLSDIEGIHKDENGNILFQLILGDIWNDSGEKL